MTELERALVQLGDRLDLPATPPLARVVRERIRRRRFARRLVVLALPLAALAIAFAVPQARSAILRFFHIGAEKVERVETLPPAKRVPPTYGLGPERTRAEAERVAGFKAQLGSLEAPQTWWARPSLLATRLPQSRSVLLIEIAGDQLGVSKKYTTARVQPAEVGTSFALWISGTHVIAYESSSALETVQRYTGNALVWARNGITYRLEGEPALDAALGDARRITP